MSLTIFLWLYFAVMSLGVLARLFLLSFVTYPRVSIWSRGNDALAILFHAAFAVWAFTLIPGG